MTRAERRYIAELKMEKNKRLAKELGLQGGSVYEKHREKINKSFGYTKKSGNITHYVAAGNKPKTNNKKSYGSAQRLSTHDERLRDSAESQLNDIEYDK
jgi:hypothetical protein